MSFKLSNSTSCASLRKHSDTLTVFKEDKVISFKGEKMG